MYIYIYIYIYVYTHIYTYVYVCVYIYINKQKQKSKQVNKIQISIGRFIYIFYKTNHCNNQQRRIRNAKTINFFLFVLRNLKVLARPDYTDKNGRRHFVTSNRMKQSLNQSINVLSGGHFMSNTYFVLLGC